MLPVCSEGWAGRRKEFAAGSKSASRPLADFHVLRQHTSGETYDAGIPESLCKQSDEDVDTSPRAPFCSGISVSGQCYEETSIFIHVDILKPRLYME